MRLLRVALPVLIILTAGLSLLPVQNQIIAQSEALNWSLPGYDQFNTNNDPQNLINVNNVNTLQVKWIYQVPVNPFLIPGSPPALGIETTPLIVNGIIYVATPYNRIMALNAENGRLVWYYQVNLSSFASDPWWSNAYTISSISYYDGIVYMMASDTSVYGFDAINGSVVWYLPAVAANIPGNTGQYYGEKAPLIYNGEIIVRASTTDYGGRGFVAAYSLSTKQLLWIWYSVPPSGGDPSWDGQAGLGNIAAYPNDWGNTSLIGGGAAWGLMALDSSRGILYFSTGHPSDVYDASLRPGPNLYVDSIVALNATNGKMLWYYQINAHDITEHEGGWSVVLTNLTIGNQQREVVIQPAKNNYIYVLDALTGHPIYSPIHVGSPSVNTPNDNSGNNASMTLSQSVITNREICPGPDGGIEMSPAIDKGVLFVVSQNACGIMYPGPVTYKFHTINGYVYTGAPSSAQNSTLYAIDLANGNVLWTFQMDYRYQAASAVVSAGVVYIVDRGGDLYALNEQTGAVLKSISLGGLGAAGVSLGTGLSGEPILVVPVGGGDIPTATAGIVLAFTLPSQSVTNNGSSTLGDLVYIAVPAVVGILLLGYALTRRKRSRI
jgi:glucose dehydrogenase